MPNEFTALRGIQAPGTSVYGYHRGAPVTAQVVQAWELSVGEANDPEADVVAGDLPSGPLPPLAVVRPDPGANRAAWESYALANGMDAADVAAASMADLAAAGQKPARARKATRAAAEEG